MIVGCLVVMDESPWCGLDCLLPAVVPRHGACRRAQHFAIRCCESADSAAGHACVLPSLIKVDEGALHAKARGLVTLKPSR